MSKHDELANYLATGMKNYSQGVSIFKNLGIDEKSNAFFDTKTPGQMHVNLLRKQLINYARVNKVKPSSKNQDQESGITVKSKSPEKVTKSPKNEKVMIDTNPVVRFEDLPETYQEKFKQAGEMKNQEKTLHAELKTILDDESKKERRAELMKQITSIKADVKSIWAEIDQWWAENKEKTKEQRIADDAAAAAIQKQKDIKAYKTYIQRNYGNEKKAAELEKRMKQLEEWGIDYAEDIEKAQANMTEKTK